MTSPCDMMFCGLDVVINGRDILYSCVEGGRSNTLVKASFPLAPRELPGVITDLAA